MKRIYIYPKTNMSPMTPVAILMTSGDGGGVHINTTDPIDSEDDVL